MAGDEEQQDTPDKMVNVMAAHLDITEGADVVGDREHEEPNGQKCNKEADGGEKEAAMRAVGYVPMDKVAETREVQQEKEKGRDDDDEDEEYPGSSDVHGSGLEQISY